jgi:hypothetical protein
MDNRFLNNLLKEAEENPTLALAVVAGLLTAASKFANSMAWKQEVNRRTMKDRKKKK